MLHQFAVRPCFPCVNCFSDENNTLSPTPLHPANTPSRWGCGGGGNKSAPEDKTTPNEPLIALLALLLLHYSGLQASESLVYHDMTPLLAQTRITVLHYVAFIEFIQFGLRNINLGL